MEKVVSDEERKEIIDEAIELAMLKLPYVVTELLNERATISKMAKDFYERNPTYNKNKRVVASIVEKTESDNPGLQFEQILEKAKPKIDEMIKQIGSTDMGRVEKPTNLSFDDNGEL